MKVKFTKAVRVNSGDGKVYDFAPGEHAIHDSLLGAIVDQHLDAIDRKYITALQDRVLMVKANDPSVNTSRPTGMYVNANDVQDMDDELPEETQLGGRTATGADSVVPDETGTKTDEFGNVINTRSTVTTPAVGLGAASSKTVGRANPQLISTNDTISKKVDQTAQANTQQKQAAQANVKPAGTNGNGQAASKPSSDTGGASTPSSDTNK